MSVPTIGMVEDAPQHDAAEKLLNEGSSAPVGEPSTASEAPAVAPDAAAEKKKRGRKPKEGVKRTASGRISRTQERVYGREEAKASGAPAAADPLTAPVQSGPVPDAAPAVVVPEAPDPAMLEFVKPYGVKFVAAVAKIIARFAKKPGYVMQADEATGIGEALAVVAILRMPAVAMLAPEAQLFAELAGYVSRITAPADGEAQG